MSVTQPYNGLPPRLIIRRTLEYILVVVGMGDYPTYNAPDPFTAEDETNYNTEIEWLDIRTKPTWSAILANYVSAWYYYYPDGLGYERPALMWDRMNYLDQYVEEALEPNSLVKADWNASFGLAQILNKPSLATVATSGSYNDLSNKPSIPSTTRTTSTQSMSLVGTGATGTQISSTKDSQVKFTVSTSATATIAGAATSTVTLKKCATNSATEGDWTTCGVSETTQSYSLAIALQGVTGGKGQLVTDLPAGWYVKLVNTGSGTHSESFIAGEKTIYG